MRRAEGMAALLLAAAAGAAQAYTVRVPWSAPQHDVQLQFSGNSPEGVPWMAGALHTINLWYDVSGFRWRAVPSTGVDGCGYNDTTVVVRFAKRVCGENFSMLSLASSLVTTRSVNGGPVTLVDADAYLNIGPDADGYSLSHAWPQASRQVRGAIAGTAPSGVTYATAFAQAAAAWNATTPFVLTVSGSAVNPCADDTISGSGFAATVCGNAFGSTTLAVTMTTTQIVGTGPAYAVDSDILFNTAVSWDIYDGPLADAKDFRRVAVHELGHLIALGHSSIPQAIMWPFASDTATVSCDDRRGIAVSYGVNPDTLCAAPPTPAQWHEWHLYPGPYLGTAEFRRTLGATLGHLMGLGDATDPNALLWPYIGDTEHPTCDDQAGVRDAYDLNGSCRDVHDVIFRSHM